MPAYRYLPGPCSSSTRVRRPKAEDGKPVVCIANLAPVPRDGYRVGLPLAGRWEEVVNTDSTYYGGTGVGNMGAVEAAERSWHDQPYSAEVTLPPLSVIWLRPS